MVLRVSNAYFRERIKVNPLKYLILSATLLLSTSVFGQDLIKWYTWEEGMIKASDESKKFVVDLYTDWCGWCKRMDKATFQDPVIADYINKHYIAIKFNAEQKAAIDFKSKSHKYVKGGRRGYHTLAAELTGGRLSYPTVVFMDEEMEVIQALPGFLDAPTFDPIMRYFAEDMHKSKPWEAYLKEYKSGQLSPSKKNNHTRLVKGGK